MKNIIIFCFLFITSVCSTYTIIKYSDTNCTKPIQWIVEHVSTDTTCSQIFYPALQYGKVSCNTTHFSLKSFFNKDCSNPSETIIQEIGQCKNKIRYYCGSKRPEPNEPNLTSKHISASNVCNAVVSETYSKLDQCIFASTVGESYHCDGSIVNFRGFRNNICTVISSSMNVTSGQCLGFGTAGIKMTCGNSIPNSASSWSIFPMLLVFMFLIHFLE
eukprot:gene255-6670_t